MEEEIHAASSIQYTTRKDWNCLEMDSFSQLTAHSSQLTAALKLQLQSDGRRSNKRSGRQQDADVER
jgi:hypothetical protein